MPDFQNVSSKKKWGESESVAQPAFQKGDHLVSSKTGYTHHGLYVGHDQILHYAGLADGMSAGPIELISVRGFSNGRGIQVREHFKRKYSRTESVERGYRRLGENKYNVAINNCEHFVTWCITGAHSSAQVNNLVSSAAYAAIGVRSPIFQTVGVADQVLSNVVGFSGKTLSRPPTGVLMKIAAASSKGVLNISPGSLAGTGALLTTSGLSSGAAGLTLGLTASALAPLATGVAIGYGVKKLVDWVWD